MTGAEVAELCMETMTHTASRQECGTLTSKLVQGSTLAKAFVAVRT